jgi:hypothetical protein
VTTRTTALVATVLLGVSSSGCEWSSSDVERPEAATSPASTSPPEIRTSLDGMDMLPRHIPWTATVALPDDQIAGVRFSVDRESLWVDDTPPYSYGEPGAVLATAPLTHRGTTSAGVDTASPSRL